MEEAHEERAVPVEFWVLLILVMTAPLFIVAGIVVLGFDMTAFLAVTGGLVVVVSTIFLYRSLWRRKRLKQLAEANEHAPEPPIADLSAS